MKFKLWLLPFSVSLLFLLSCSREHLILVDTQKIAPTNNDLMFRFYDSKTNIRYDFRNDDSMLYVILETDNRAAQARILRKGVKIYLSPTSKIDETHYLLYPSSFNEPNRSPQDRTREIESEDPNVRRERKDVMRQRTLANISKQVVVVSNSMQQSVILGNENISGYDYYIDIDPQGFLHYEARISYKNLQIASIDKSTVVGIKIDAIEMPQGNGGNYGGGRMSGGMNMGGMGGGGMRMGGGSMGMGGRGMGAGGRMGGGMRSEGSSGNHWNSEASTEKINWWYKLMIK